jgi:8-oxo-dGTP pyrophosphatase MutT (NUDIX family)
MMRILLSGCALINEQEELLLLFKKKHQYYEFPGGKVEEGETLEETAKRECKEELGVDVTLLQYIGYENFDIQGVAFQSHKYLGSIAKNQTPKVNEPNKFETLFWLPIQQYKNYPCAPNVQAFCEKYMNGEIPLFE